MGYWKSKVLPVFKKVFEKTNPKKAAAADACKSFDDSKEEINKEFEEKKSELQPKVLEIYGASPAEIKTLVKERKEPALKKHPAAVSKFLDELVKIGFPGSKLVSEAASKLGPALVSAPVFFLFEKVAILVPEVQEPAAESEPAAREVTAEEAAGGEAAAQEKEVVAEEEEKEGEKEEKRVEEVAAPAATAVTEPAAVPAASTGEPAVETAPPLPPAPETTATPSPPPPPPPPPAVEAEEATAVKAEASKS